MCRLGVYAYTTRAAESEVRNARPATIARRDDPSAQIRQQPQPGNAEAPVRGNGRQVRGTSLNKATRQQRKRERAVVSVCTHITHLLDVLHYPFCPRVLELHASTPPDYAT
jgi:hypothetical protein